MAQDTRKTIRIKQIGSPIRRPAHQRQTLIGLGLNKMHRVVEREDRKELTHPNAIESGI